MWGDCEEPERCCQHSDRRNFMETIFEALNLARDAIARGDVSRAVFIFERILKAVPEEAYALNGLALVALAAGRFAQAESYLQRAIATLGDDPEFHYNLSTVYRSLGRDNEALSALRKAAAIAPDSVKMLNGLAFCLQQCGHDDEAGKLLQRALAVASDSADTHQRWASFLVSQGRAEEAIPAFRRAIELSPDVAQQHVDLAIALRSCGAVDESLASLRRALELDPNGCDAQELLADWLAEKGRYDEAEAARRRAMELAFTAHQLRDDLVLSAADRPAVERAVERLERALAINPNSGRGYCTLASTLHRLGRYDEAERAFRRAMELEPADCRAPTELAVMLKNQGRMEEAQALFDQAVRLAPESAEIRRNRAMLKLLLGDFSAGFAEYEWRWRMAEAEQVPQAVRWRGEAMPGVTLLLVAEQGFGDAIQFVRYAPLVKARSGARVVLHCAAALHELLASAAGIDGFTSGPTADQKCDCYAPLFSLPTVFETTLNSVPANVPYLASSPQRAAEWKARLADSFPGRFKVGIAWQGNPVYTSDASRSIPLDYFIPLAACPGVQLISLQKDFGREQLTRHGRHLGIVDLGATLDQQGGAFVDTAAVIANLDLVITSDTAIAHLAGALGKPVWVALAHVPDWRWLLARADSPWYPTMRLFRQSRPGDWKGVFERFGQELAACSARDSLSGAH